MSEEKTIELNTKLQKIATELEGLTVLEMADLASYPEDKFGVMAMPVASSAPAASAESGPVEEKRLRPFC